MQPRCYGTSSLIIALFVLCVAPPTRFPPRSELASIPQASGTVAAQDEAQAEADAAAATDNVEQMPIAVSAGEEIQSSAAEQGFVIENKAVGPTPSPASST